MPAITIDINATAGEQKVARLLRAIESQTLLKAIGGGLLGYVDRQFKTHGGGSWSPLSQLTLQLRQHGGNQPLRDSGHYAHTFVSDSGGPGTDYQTDNQTYVEVGSNLKVGGFSLAKIQEFGTGPYTIRVKRAKVLAAQTRAGAWFFFGKEVHHPGVPARPVLPTAPAAEQMIKETVDAMLAVAAKDD